MVQYLLWKMPGETAMDDLFGRKHKVLIVDDSDTNRAILAEILSEEYEIIEADSGENALQII